ncbi:hypothetical protein F4553_004761 [Allocatelliglobosispora scoriae]|uniref:Fibronectin type-III domain-containing protein n=1 Tax=Allocatelliglobosispora scoriae TaxID=643052 RepID=A0A841BX97_9ACTN|nr:fibronectin type III domain-containing protein [Allocatelliglobosispora scoriae]MBB5871382.1 hypothetical protein [Allocatelliglobosispora scoriae]
MQGRTRALLALGSTLVTALAAVLLIAPPAQAANLLANPGFETGTLSPWTCSAALGSVVSTPVHSGTRALQGAVTAGDNAKCIQTVAVVPSTTYTITAWVRGGGGYVYLGITGGNSTWNPGAASAWVQLTLTHTTAAGQTSLQVYLNGWYGQPAYNADDVSVDGPGGTGVPGIPGNPSAGTITNTSIALSWGASSGTVTGYRVYEGTTVRATVTGTSTTISGLSACTGHTYTVAAYNSTGESGKSGGVTATTSGCTGAPGVPGNLTVGTVTNTSITLSWSASSGTVTGYRVYEGSIVRATVTGTSATITWLTACTGHAYTVAAYNSTGESAKSAGTTGTTTGCPSGGKHAWPYIDITFTSPSMASIMAATGQKYFTIAFALGSAAGCVPAWGATIPLNDSRIINDINAVKAAGGDMKIAFGGAVSPYLEASCTSVNSLAAAYEQVIDTTGVRNLDIDIEASINIDQMNKALAKVQAERPGTTVSFTLMIVSDSYGMIDSLGVDLLKNAKANGVNVTTVNPMTMDFSQSAPDWGDAVIGAATKTLEQMAGIWPEKTDAQRKAMLGVTPMIGKNDTGPIFDLADADQLVAWANANHINSLGFWSVGRDNGGCPGGPVSPTCSSISQSTWAFTNKFKTFVG